MSLEPKIHITLKKQDRQQNLVTIRSERLLHVSQVFRGQSINQTLGSLPLLFNVCGVAQSCAAVTACEYALGMQDQVNGNAVRTQLLMMETVREHLWRIFLDWPGALGQPADREGMAQALEIQKRFSRSLAVQPALFLPGGASCDSDMTSASEARKQLHELVLQKILGVAPEQWLKMTGEDELKEWARQSVQPAGRLVDSLYGREWVFLGANGVEGLGNLRASELKPCLLKEQFIAQPEWQGRVKETTPLIRAEHPLLLQLQRQYGNGVLSRVVSRLIELGQLAIQLDRPDHSLIGGERETGVDAAIAQVEAARGRLIHRVELEGEQILGYQILAPTEWNFHPRGVVAQSLAQLEGSRGVVRQQAELIINSIDPCVGYDLLME